MKLVESRCSNPRLERAFGKQQADETGNGEEAGESAEGTQADQATTEILARPAIYKIGLGAARPFQLVKDLPTPESQQKCGL